MIPLKSATMFELCPVRLGNRTYRVWVDSVALIQYKLLEMVLSIFVRKIPKSIVAVKLNTVAFRIADIENGMPIVVLKFP